MTKFLILAFLLSGCATGHPDLFCSLEAPYPGADHLEGFCVGEDSPDYPS